MKPEKDSVGTTMVVPTGDAKRQRKEKKPLGVGPPPPSPSPQQPERKRDVNKQNNNRNATIEGIREKPLSPLNSRPAAAEDTTDVVETKTKTKTKSSEKPSPSLLLLQKFSPHRKVIAQFPAAAAASSASATWPSAATK